MSDVTIGNLPTAGGIDGSADYLAIETASPHATNKINRNILLGITSQPLGLTDTQSPTNKTFNNTTTLTIKDTLFTLQDDSDTTKQAKFQLSGITTATTRTYTLPNASSTLADIATAQTFTNKTITAPAITGGTIDNSTITVDSIAGHSSATTVTVANLQIVNGVLNSANAVTATSIAAGAVQPQALTSGTGTGWAWSSWTPTWTNLTPGNGTIEAKYSQIGKTIIARCSIVFGSTTTISGALSFSLPVTSTSYNGIGSSIFPLGVGEINDSGTARFVAEITLASTTTVLIQVSSAGSTYVSGTALSSTVPMTWTTNDGLFLTFVYEAA